jgi:hypothetical protein
VNKLFELLQTILSKAKRLFLIEFPTIEDQAHQSVKTSPRLGKIVSSSEPQEAIEDQAHQAVKTSPRLGKIVYSSESQEALERASGEKLYKISEGVYVNQVTREDIDSEPKPVIEHESSEPFTSHSYENPNILCAVWHPVEPKLICIGGAEPDTPTCLTLNVDSKGLHVEAETALALKESTGAIKWVAHHPSMTYLLLTCENQLVIWDYSANNIVARIETTGREIREGGFYPDQQTAWTLEMEKEYRVGYDWLIWDYSENQLNRYELERNDHYGRGATLHPSGLLIGAAWNAHMCGYFIHQSRPKSDYLHYYSKPAPERPEYESYLPRFSPDGKRLALFVNAFLALHQNHSKVCVYDVETAGLVVEFFSGTTLPEQQLQFCYGGKTLAFWDSKSNKLHIFNAMSGKQINTFTFDSKIKYFTAHHIYPYYAIVHATGVTTYCSAFEDDSLPSHTKLNESAMGVARRFIETNAKHLVRVKYWLDEL